MYRGWILIEKKLDHFACHLLQDTLFFNVLFYMYTDMMSSLEYILIIAIMFDFIIRVLF